MELIESFVKNKTAIKLTTTHDIPEILLKMALNTTKQTKNKHERQT
jgi:hypothetical protein